ncbi:GlxA family transcriptional regulator [Puniceibacterium sp. IMCC21224]|uniref:GlxA family transcriptional regulator n=1 Tax=Puniceibacterium sp. IMCC21224 TaxID=1618204 RepID=UPI00064DBA82|nr:GlxA family transcriptional regulator [Puniceibacterium sp. IMCC21224]KMK67295.1 transcriptional regulator, AraC family with amidase-like domain [Puniceibacterium sp. IMCC21224]
MPKQTEPTTRPIKIAFLLFDRFSNLCLANCLEPMRAANTFAPHPAYRWRFLTPDGAPVRSSSGLTVSPDCSVAGMTPVDRLFIVASYDHLAHDTPATRRLLARAAGQSQLVAGLDAGAWLMASAGLLHGRQATIHWDLLDAFSERFLQVNVIRAPHLRDGDRLTCAGAMAAFDMTHNMIRTDLGPAIALDVEGLFLTDRPTLQPAPKRGDALVRRALDMMRTELETPLTLGVLARRVGTTPRTLTRRCQAALGLTPGVLYRHIRLSAARQMVEGSSSSIAEIALRCGYEDPAALTRAFRLRFGCAPRQMRLRSAATAPQIRTENATDRM